MEDIDLSLESYGVSVVYHDSQYKKKIKLIVNTCSGFHDDFNIYEYIEMVDKRIWKYFDHKYRINDFTLSGMQIFILMDVGTRENVSSYLKVMKRIGKVKGFTPCSYEDGADKNSICWNGNSNGIQFVLYDFEKVRQEESGAKSKCWKGILRADVHLKKPKAIKKYTDANNTIRQITDLFEHSVCIFGDAFTRIIPFGEFYKKDKAIEIVCNNVSDHHMRRKMLQLLELIPKKKSLLLAQKEMKSRDIRKIMDAFFDIKLAPVTIGKRQDVKHLENLYVYLLDKK